VSPSHQLTDLAPPVSRPASPFHPRAPLDERVAQARTSETSSTPACLAGEPALTLDLSPSLPSPPGTLDRLDVSPSIPRAAFHMLRLASSSLSASPARWAPRTRVLLAHSRGAIPAASSFHSSALARLDTERQSPSSSSHPPPNLDAAARRRVQQAPAEPAATAPPRPFDPQQPNPEPAPPIAPPAPDARVPKRRITSMMELPKSFGRNQIIEVPEQVQRDLENVLGHFQAPVRYAFAYGSGVFRQKGYTEKVRSSSFRRSLVHLLGS